MEDFESDYRRLLRGGVTPPCLSLYQPTHRHHPDNRQDPIRFRNLVRVLEASLRQKYAVRETRALIAPFEALAGDAPFWNHTLDGLAVLGAADRFSVLRLQRPVAELAIVADSFHTKPLLRIAQSADRYQILGLGRHTARLFEGSRDVLDEIEPAPGVPRHFADVVGEAVGGVDRRKRVYGAGPGGTTRHGTDQREELTASETARFFRAVDRAVLERHSRPSGLPLLLAALPEHHHLFRTLSRNPQLHAEGIEADPGALTLEQLRARAWERLEPGYRARLAELIERFGAAAAADRGTGDPARIARAAAAGRIGTLLIEAERGLPGTFDAATGAIRFAALDDTTVDDLIDDLGERALKDGAEVVVVPAARMPTDTGLAAIYRF